MLIDTYRLQHGIMMSNKPRRRIAREAHMQLSELRSVELNGRCTKSQRDALAAATGIDPHDLMLMD